MNQMKVGTYLLRFFPSIRYVSFTLSSFLALSIVFFLIPNFTFAITFVDVTSEAGIDFQHTNGANGKKYTVETIGSGAAFFDFDSDGDL
ncbi:MAG: hypothetical protein ACE1ZS_11125, partial [Candidatus Poribacteria bacterium]